VKTGGMPNKDVEKEILTRLKDAEKN